MNTVNRIHDLIIYCLFEDGESRTNAVMVDGISSTFGFHPGRLEESRSEISEIVRTTISNDFFEGHGGSTSFLSLPISNNGNIWGQQKDAEALLVMSIAIGIARILVPRDIWHVFPGEMPYVSFNLAGVESKLLNHEV